MGGEGGVDRRRSHPSSGGASRVETRLLDGTQLTDYETAHNRAGDPTYQTDLPDTCAACWARAEAAEEAVRAEAEARVDGQP